MSTTPVHPTPDHTATMTEASRIITEQARTIESLLCTVADLSRRLNPDDGQTPYYKARAQRAAREYGIDYEWLTERATTGALRRDPERIMARWRMIEVLRARGMSTTEVAAALGYNSHTPIIQAEREIERKRADLAATTPYGWQR